MTDRNKQYTDLKRVNYLANWCNDNHLSLKQNHEVFFISERVLMKPEYMINNKVYVDLVDPSDLNDKYFEYARLFSLSFGTIILIPRSTVSEINSINKKDMEARFNFKF
jgi:hypothetical protein